MSAAMNTPVDIKIDIKKGLEGVVADSTAISLVEGDLGRLSYRGYTVEDLLARPFIDAAYLIVFGELPDAAQHSAFEEFLWQAGQLPSTIQSLITQLSGTTAHPMEILQAITPVL